MDASNLDPVDLMLRLIEEYAPDSIWSGSRLETYRRLGNTNRGQVGEDFVRCYLEAHDISVETVGSRTTHTDLLINDKLFEVKTASLGATGTFQFNHVRLDRDYDYLLCLGICPHQVVFNMWRKGAVAEGRAGRLVRMAEGQAVTYKLTKRLNEMDAIGQLPERIHQAIGGNRNR